MEKDPTESEKLPWLLVRRLLRTTWSMDVKWNFFVCLIDFLNLFLSNKIYIKKNILRCCLYEHAVDALLRADNTQNRLVLDVRGTAFKL